jgi:hypothetical protein
MTTVVQRAAPFLRKLRHCFNCGKELGFYAEYDPTDHCGRFECHQAAFRKRREIGEQDRSMGWG